MYDDVILDCIPFNDKDIRPIFTSTLYLFIIIAARDYNYIWNFMYVHFYKQVLHFWTHNQPPIYKQLLLTFLHMFFQVLVLSLQAIRVREANTFYPWQYCRHLPEELSSMWSYLKFWKENDRKMYLDLLNYFSSFWDFVSWCLWKF